MVICYRDYAATPGSVGAASEELVLTYNPRWPMAKGYDGHSEWAHDLGAAGFEHVETFGFDVTVEFTHEQWRGRMRSSNGVAASLSAAAVAAFDAAAVAAFDADLARLLRERFPAEPLEVPHRIWALVAR